jgi:hypothetical protein
MQSTNLARRTSPRRQHGLTAISWILIIALAAFLGLIALKLIPIYLQAFNIATVVKQLPDEPFIGDKGPAEIRRSLIARLKINSVYDFDPKNIVIKKGLNTYLVDVSYEVREPVLGNVDIVVSFSNQTEIKPTTMMQ